MLGQISVHGFVAGKREADAGGDEAVRFLGGILADDGERYLAGLHVLEPFGAGYYFPVGRGDRGDAEDGTRGNARVAEAEVAARKSLTMFTDAFGAENFIR